MMLRTFLILVMFFYDAMGHPASCTEDSQCSSGFYCEESAHYCRECLRCDELKRESPARDVCVKSVLQCGACFKGLVADILGGGDRFSAACVAGSADAGAPHAYLPAYAWAAIAVAVLLMLVTLTLFLKTKAFKVVAYSSRTSVQSLRPVDAAATTQHEAPPPYNFIPPTFPSSFIHADAPVIQQLVDSPQSSKKPLPLPRPPDRPRESSASQAARVYNAPAYVRVPQNLSRCNSPELSPSVPEVGEGNSVPTSDGARSDVANTNNTKFVSVANPTGVNGSETNQENIVTRAGRARNQDSNNNRPTTEGTATGEKFVGGPSRDAYIIGGPSFVINVVENINNLRQRNETNFCRSESS